MVPTESKIYFFFQTPVSLRQRKRLKGFIEQIFKKEKRRLQSLNFIFCTDEQLLVINRQYLNHNYYTDIITFELSQKEAPVEGEIYISVERVKENAAALAGLFYNELHRVIFHGVLHLCGYKDKTTRDSKLMRIKEDQYLSLYLK